MKTILVVFTLIFILGCASQRPVLVPEKRSKERFALLRATEEANKEIEREIILTPQETGAADKGIEVTIKYATPEDLKTFFTRTDIFNKPKKNPYPLGVIVFSVKIANNSGGRIRVEPREFIMVDDLSTQQSFLSPGYIAALHNRGTLSMFAETGAEYAPGFYSAPFGVAERIASSSFRKRSALLSKVTLSGGYVYDGVVYEGYISFIRPNPKAKTLNLILPNIRTDFDAGAKATDAVDFRFKFNVTYDTGANSKGKRAKSK